MTGLLEYVSMVTVTMHKSTEIQHSVTATRRYKVTKLWRAELAVKKKKATLIRPRLRHRASRPNRISEAGIKVAHNFYVMF